MTGKLDPVKRGTRAVLDALGRAAEADHQWPAAAVYVPDLDLMVTVDGKGMLLQGELAPAVAARLDELDSAVVCLPVEVDGRQFGGAGVHPHILRDLEACLARVWGAEAEAE